MKRFLSLLACVLALGSLGACAVVASPDGTAVMAPIAPPVGVTVVAAPRMAPGPGYLWRYHPRWSWGWYRPGWGWHRPGWSGHHRGWGGHRW
jgi:hypothetical protein